MAKINNKVETLLKANPHMTMAEAIKYVTMNASKVRDSKISANIGKEVKAQVKKGKTPVKSVNTVSGGKVSPR